MEWIIENLIHKYIAESKTIVIDRIQQAKGNAQLTLWCKQDRNAPKS